MGVIDYSCLLGLPQNLGYVQIALTPLPYRPVSRTRRLCGTQLLSEHFKVVNFC